MAQSGGDDACVKAEHETSKGGHKGNEVEGKAAHDYGYVSCLVASTLSLAGLKNRPLVDDSSSRGVEG